MNTTLEEIEKVKNLVKNFITIFKKIENNKLKSALILYKHLQQDDNNPREINKVKILLDKMNIMVKKMANEKAFKFLKKNIKYIFDQLPQ